jgi:ABC-2 type transport system ATP-binding protein
MIEARELTKRYGDTTAVHSLSFTIAPGTVTGFLGPNGAGKFTTMRMIMGLDRRRRANAPLPDQDHIQSSTPLSRLPLALGDIVGQRLSCSTTRTCAAQ